MATNVLGSTGGLDKRWQLFDTAPSMVEKKFNMMMDYGVQGYQIAMTAIQLLSALAGQLQLINRAISLDTTLITQPVITATPPTIDTTQYRVDYPTKPVEPSLIDATMAPLPTDFPSWVDPSAIITGDTTYVSSLLTALKSKLLRDLQEGSIGIEPAIEQAIFDRERERALLEYQDEIDRTAANWARGGFPLPNGGLRAAQNKVEINFTNKRLDMSRDIAIKSFELALQNSHFIIQQIVAVENMLVHWAEAVATRIFEASKAAAELTISSFRAKLDGVKEQALVIIEEAKAKIEYNRGLIQIFVAQIEAFSSQMRAEAERINAVARGDEAQVAVFKSIADFEISLANLDLKVIEARIYQAVSNANILIKDKEVEMKNYEVLNNMKIEAEKAIGQIAAQLVAGALSAVHAQISASASDTANYSATTGELLLTGEIP
jgi:hypothetical protein